MMTTIQCQGGGMPYNPAACQPQMTAVGCTPPPAQIQATPWTWVCNYAQVPQAGTQPSGIVCPPPPTVFCNVQPAVPNQIGYANTFQLICLPPATYRLGCNPYNAGAAAIGGHTNDTIVTGATCLCPPTIVGCPPPAARIQATPWTWVCGYAQGGGANAAAIGGHTNDTIVTGATCLCPPTIVGCPPPAARIQATPWTWVCGYAQGGGANAAAVGGHTGDTVVTGATCLCPPTTVGCPPPAAAAVPATSDYKCAQTLGAPCGVTVTPVTICCPNQRLTAYCMTANFGCATGEVCQLASPPAGGANAAAQAHGGATRTINTINLCRTSFCTSPEIDPNCCIGVSILPPSAACNYAAPAAAPNPNRGATCQFATQINPTALCTGIADPQCNCVATQLPQTALFCQKASPPAGGANAQAATQHMLCFTFQPPCPPLTSVTCNMNQCP